MWSKLLLCALLPLSAFAVDPTVTIASGVLIGKTTTVSSQPTVTNKVNAYLGVPFAKSPPVRFSPPQAPNSWSSPLKVQSQKPACIQQFITAGDTSGGFQSRLKQYFNNPNATPPPESEDCLYLNVFTPAGVNANSKKPVLFWLFGGNLQFGTASLGYYDGSSFAASQDVVVVTINYRTNIFGFSSSPEIPFGQQNAGFLDQRLALQWVQNNIAQFGGDPTKVTIFGESAGGYSVKQLLANPPNPLPFASAILESEQAGLFGNGTSDYNKVLAHFNCLNIACLRTVSATDIKTYIEQNSLFFPPVQNDGTSTNDIRGSINSGKFPRIPTIWGTNLNEFRVFLAIAGITDGTAALNYVFNKYGVTDQNQQNNMINTYQNNGYNVLYDIADRIATDLAFTCTTANIVSYLNSYGYSVWRYRYDASFPNLQLFPNAGAYHTSEIPQVFGTYPGNNQFGSQTTQQVQLSAYMQTTWANLAKGTTPSWARFGSQFNNDLGNIGANGGTGATTISPASSDYACGLYGGIEDATGLSW